ncbi:hypothetical protein Csa_003091 [Cucumis sativus]|uniref:Uncharacterized protein n=1 Tax=Cucumis sativus TaxID=3659 RepID=A0A0A0KM72_CUCSA|nr:hypothetical protein Csa_003091 [Cucumis sativus]
MRRHSKIHGGRTRRKAKLGRSAKGDVTEPDRKRRRRRRLGFADETERFGCGNGDGTRSKTES